MPKDPKILSIIEGLITGTEDGSVTWKPHNSCFNSAKSYAYETTTEDGKTMFQTEVSLDDNYQLKFYPNVLWINNSSLIDSKIMCSGGDYSRLSKLQELIYYKYVKALVPKINEGEILDNILNNISGAKQRKRDSILTEILSETIEDNNKDEISENKKKKTFLDKLLNRH